MGMNAYSPKDMIVPFYYAKNFRVFFPNIESELISILERPETLDSRVSRHYGTIILFIVLRNFLDGGLIQCPLPSALRNEIHF